MIRQIIYSSKTLQPALLLAICSMISLSSKGQQTNLIGFNLSSEVYPGGLRLVPGISFETQLGKHSGIETGLYYRTEKAEGTITYTDSTGSRMYDFAVMQRHLNLPVLYKYYSRLVNLSVGPTLDLYIGWNQKMRQSSIKVESFDTSPKLKVGFLAKVGKAIPAGDRIIIEPEIRFASIQGLEQATIGVGLAAKYNFFDLH